jgi:hypothetical protein
MSNLKAVAPASYNTLTYQRSLVDQTDRSSFLKPYECVDNTDGDVNKKLAPGYPAYTKENCELALKQAKAVEKLNCSLIFFPPIAGYRYCSPKETNTYFTSLRYPQPSYFIICLLGGVNFWFFGFSISNN